MGSQFSDEGRSASASNGSLYIGVTVAPSKTRFDATHLRILACLSGFTYWMQRRTAPPSFVSHQMPCLTNCLGKALVLLGERGGRVELPWSHFSCPVGDQCHRWGEVFFEWSGHEESLPIGSNVVAPAEAGTVKLKHACLSARLEARRGFVNADGYNVIVRVPVKT